MIDIRRSRPAPESLRTTKAYDGDDVRERLIEDFHDKCYLCEGKLSGSFQVEHLRPKADFPARRQEWSNLFPAHGDTCNQRRLKWPGRGMIRDGRELSWPRGGMLDCAGAQNVEGRLQQWFQSAVGDIVVHFLPTNAGDRAASNTAEELQHLHRGSSLHARKIRRLIESQYRLVLICLGRVKNAALAGDDAELARYAAELRGLTSREAPYTALLRTTLEQDRQIPEMLRDLLGFGVPSGEE